MDKYKYQYEIKFKQCQKNNKKYVINAVNNSTGIISPTEAKNILLQLGEGETAKRTSVGKIDALSNLSGEIKVSKLDHNLLYFHQPLD